MRHAAPSSHAGRLHGVAEAAATLQAGLAGGSAAVVAAPGQVAWATVLAPVAFGIVLRVWRRRWRARTAP